MSIWRSILKFIKFFLVHPSTEIIISILYLISFIFIGVLLFKESSNYDDHQILDITQSFLDFKTFNKIKTPFQFENYLSFLLNKLYTINPASNEIPLFIPMSPIRFIPFINSNDCNTQIYYNKTCIGSSEKFKCVIEYLTEAYKHKCGKQYSDKKSFLERKLTGHYSDYSIANAENFIDFTKDSYLKYQNKIEEIIKDKQLKALVMQINLKAPSNQNFIDVILGIEMTNYFTDVKTIFSVYILNENRPKKKILLFTFIILLSCTVVLNGVKCIYEINLKAVWSIHFFYFFEEIFDVAFMILCLIYINEDKQLTFEINLEIFESHLNYINILWYTKTIYAFLVIFFPFRFFSLITWWKGAFEPIIIILNILFRMGPGILISLIFFLLMVVMFVFINYFLYNDIFPYYESMYKSFISTFNFKILMTLYRRKPASRIFGNLFQSKFSISNILFQLVFFYFSLALIIATLVYSFKKAIFIMAPQKENKYMIKLEEIEKKINEDKFEEYKNFDLMRKHILWWNLDGKISPDNDFISKYEALIFKNSNQILAFLKYIFAVRPEIQFKKLIYKLNIIIETNKKKLGDSEIRQLMALCEWLVFVGSKIPIFIYGKTKFEASVRMKLKSLYELIYFINDEKILQKKLEEKGIKILTISDKENLTFPSKIKIE